MSKFSFDPMTCIGCGSCVQACPKGLLRMENDRPVMPEALSARCNNCGQCVAYCPTKASMQAFNANVVLEDALPMNGIDPKMALAFLKSRRSYRQYDSQPVDHETLVEILEAANYAPSGGNNRTLRWIVIEDPKKTKELADVIATWFDTVCRTHPVYGKRYAIDSILERYRGGKDVILRGAPHVAYCVGPANAVWGPVDTGIALTYFNLACEAHQIGCCFAGYATKAAESDLLRDWLGLQEGEVAWCALCFGRKTVDAFRIPNRGPVPVTYL